MGDRADWPCRGLGTAAYRADDINPSVEERRNVSRDDGDRPGATDVVGRLLDSVAAGMPRRTCTPWTQSSSFGSSRRPDYGSRAGTPCACTSNARWPFPLQLTPVRVTLHESRDPEVVVAEYDYDGVVHHPAAVHHSQRAGRDHLLRPDRRFPRLSRPRRARRRSWLTPDRPTLTTEQEADPDDDQYPGREAAYRQRRGVGSGLSGASAAEKQVADAGDAVAARPGPPELQVRVWGEVLDQQRRCTTPGPS